MIALALLFLLLILALPAYAAARYIYSIPVCAHCDSLGLPNFYCQCRRKSDV